MENTQETKDVSQDILKLKAEILDILEQQAQFQQQIQMLEKRKEERYGVLNNLRRNQSKA